MYDIKLENLYIVDTVLNNPSAKLRAEKLSNALYNKDPGIISRQEMQDIYKNHPARQPSPFPRRTGAFDYSAG